MKKQLLLSARIAIMAAILISGACTRANGQNRTKEAPEKVAIYLRSIEIKKEKHLLMFDSNGNFATDSLKTIIRAGGSVFWELDPSSGIKKIERIYPSRARKIFTEDAKKQVFGKGFKLKVPDNIPENTEEEYIIEYIDQDNLNVKIDPYIRIED
ncbi:MAG: hypothetical protein A2X05_11810 [Bacteroidetes bacterium GWE2_41_25]|nr:MAG: hypothetical protein A2X03_02850 [Bacteroidetes bacterium GWA2_40_15]OFX92453.1 MAG: hypothetical protein A2X06_05850 [Bacteroidetes bacterium GWC2_40_22]OFX92595.1 MAG: hypothetical protein A2X05_11810 [Bacteroidetes bacterium GWE2_41_25]OFY58344.1 MAG: hypothetical protein A2X04_12835 [Bacteroidetes bacterium GWF2_41_9]HCT85634.1 hypothetical protein [Candidatus Margulisiibacteriota bacterium]